MMHLEVASAAVNAGVFDAINDVNSSALVMFRTVSVTVAVALVLLAWFKSKTLVGALAALLTAGVVLYGIWNITDVRDAVGDDVKLAPPLVDVASAGTI